MFSGNEKDFVPRTTNSPDVPPIAAQTRYTNGCRRTRAPSNYNPRARGAPAHRSGCRKAFALPHKSCEGRWLQRILKCAATVPCRAFQTPRGFVARPFLRKAFLSQAENSFHPRATFPGTRSQEARYTPLLPSGWMVARVAGSPDLLWCDASKPAGTHRRWEILRGSAGIVATWYPCNCWLPCRSTPRAVDLPAQ